MEDIITSYLEKFDLDVRKSNDARFMDQKCTPDVVCFIADCIMNLIAPDEEFAVADIWNAQYFIKNAQAIFGKPRPTKPSARHEYDKFIQQPLRMLAYSHILSIEKRKNTNYYKVINWDILEYISQRERNTFVFLCCYLQKVLGDSDQLKYFEDYKEKNKRGTVTKEDFRYLKDRYAKFIIGHTKVNTKLECNRLFPKVINVYAVQNQIRGSKGGYMDTSVTTFSDLMYNQRNWRDLNKDKSTTRQEAEKEKSDPVQQEAYNSYYVQKAINLLKKIQISSEVKDRYANGDATQVHHIFPKSQFPELAHYLENLIKLTATQHYTLAHPSNNTQLVNRDYQLTCLLAKADTIEKSLQSVGSKYYRKESFVFVINTGLEVELSVNLSFSDIKGSLIKIYNS